MWGFRVLGFGTEGFNFRLKCIGAFGLGAIIGFRVWVWVEGFLSGSFLRIPF